MRVRVVAALATAVSLGCATSGAGPSSSAASGGSRSQDVIAEAEITSRAREATNALQIIQTLRPQMLRSRGMSSIDPRATGEETLPRVYVDEISYGNLSTLSNVNANQIKEIRFVNARDATTRWGTGHTGGVILVTTKK
jgi:hypothetical protein